MLHCHPSAKVDHTPDCLWFKKEIHRLSQMLQNCYMQCYTNTFYRNSWFSQWPRLVSSQSHTLLINKIKIVSIHHENVYFFCSTH